MVSIGDERNPGGKTKRDNPGTQAMVQAGANRVQMTRQERDPRQAINYRAGGDYTETRYTG